MSFHSFPLRVPFHLCKVLLCHAVVLTALLCASVAQAATFTITNTGDNNGVNPAPNAGTGTLRQAIIDANNAAGSDTITFAAGVTNSIQLQSALPDLSAVTITGPGANVLTVGRTGAANYRIFTIPEGVTSSISGLEISGGSVTGFGGGINNSGTLTVTNCNFVNNKATKDGGALSNFHGTLTVSGCTFVINSAGDNGGAIVNDATVDDSGGPQGPATLSVTNSTLTNNSASAGGGGIANLSGTVTIDTSTLQTNSATGLGGGLFTFDGSATITASTFDNNQADEGGGLYSASGTILRNSTLSGNKATRRGGGLSNTNQLTQIDSATISSNKAPTGQGAGIASVGDDGSTTTRLLNSIVAGNLLPNGNTGTDIDFNGNQISFASNGYNIIGTGSGLLTENGAAVFTQTGDRTNVTNPGLAALANNGGPTQTRALLAQSPAINTGNTTLLADQRGIARPQGTQDDVGAYEFNSFASSLIVTTLADENDATSDPAYGSGTSLREAIDFANSNANASTITFNLPGSGVKVITLTSALSRITAPLTIQGPGASVLTIARDTTSGNFRILDVASNSFTISGLTLSNGSSLERGGAINNTSTQLTVTNCTFSNNQADSGGAIASSGVSNITITGSTFLSNFGNEEFSNGGGGAILVDSGPFTVQNSVFSGNQSKSNGGAIWNDGTLTLTNCTLENNAASSNGGGVHNSGTATLTNCTLNNNSAYEGGGVNSITSFSTGNVTTLRNCTLSGNTADFYGGGLNNERGATIVDSCTITANTATPGRGAGVYSASTASARTEIRNSIVAGNIDTDVDFGSQTFNSFQSNGYNIVGDGNAISKFVETGDVNDVSGSALKIGPLAANGGTTKTHALLAGSPALNTGNTTLATDQRGITRPQGAADDKGAYEFQSGTLPTLSINNLSITEGDTGTKNATFTITLSAVSTQVVSVNAIPTNGTGKAPGDYTSGGLKITFQPNETTKTFNVPVVGDTTSEATETFFVVLSSPVNATIASGKGRGTGTIADNDPLPAISVSDIIVQEGNFGTRAAVFTLKLSKASGQIVRVNCATANGTATAGTSSSGADYTALNSTQFAFPTGRDAVIVRVVINSDLSDEANETFTLNLTAPVGATIADAQSLATINDDDPLPSLSIGNASIAEGNGGTKTLNFTVTLTGTTARAVSATYATSNGTAAAGQDYLTKTGTLNFPVGTTVQTVSVTINGDTAVEGNETFFVLLSAPVNAALGVGRGTGTINNDDAAPGRLSPITTAQAYASSSSIALTFADAKSPSAASNFAATVNGKNATVQGIVRNGTSVTLLLPEGTLTAGDAVAVTWNDGSANLVVE